VKIGFRTLRERWFQHGGRKGLSYFRSIFEGFRELLDYNNRVLELIADMGDKLSGDFVFDTHYLQKTASELDDLVYRIIYNLNSVTGNRHLGLYDAFETIRKRIRAELAPDRLPSRKDWIIPLSQTDLDLADLVGGKMGTLGEIGSRLGKRVPAGFVITTHAYRRFVNQEKVAAVLSKAFEELDAGTDPGPVSERVRLATREARMPEELEKGMKRALKDLEEEGHTHFSVRSSAIGEDGELSFAGQYASFLQVPQAQVAMRYKDVVASLFSPRAISYRREHGLRHQEAAMAVGVLAMVEPRVSGVMYTRDPESADQDVVLVSAAWGLARTVVDGRSGTDFYRVDRLPPYKILQTRIGKKERQLLPDERQGEREESVPIERQMAPCLSDADLQGLAEMAGHFESFFRNPQDIEWSIDDAGEWVILQSRPLRVRDVEWIEPEQIAEATRAHPRLMEDAGMVACRGIGAGKVVHVLSDADFGRFQRGSVLVTRSTSPKFSPLVPLCSAIVTDIGTPTGHMATVARDYRVPTLVDAGAATERLEEGMEVTVDAEERVIYQGIVRELLHFQTLMEKPFADAREFRMLRRLLKNISPLYLTNPESKEFSPENCRTYHDITRFCHETVVRELINFHLRGRRWKRIPTYRLSLPVPLGLVVIDIGDGIRPGATGRTLTPEQIVSAPLHDLLEGLCQEGVWRTDPVDLDFRSFMTSFTRTSNTAAMDPGVAQNLAVISRDYLNLNLRLGYHFNMVDTILTENRNDNYIYFRFLGGVTDRERRSRRAKFLGHVLTHYDFVVEVKGDLVVARIRKISQSMMESRLSMLGRLIGYARQLDVLMKSDEAVERFAREFLEPVTPTYPISQKTGGIP
jgi:pyruvate,water dikinase